MISGRWGHWGSSERLPATIVFEHIRAHCILAPVTILFWQFHKVALSSLLVDKWGVTCAQASNNVLRTNKMGYTQVWNSSHWKLIQQVTSAHTSLEMFCIWGGGGTEKSKRPQVGQHDLPHSEGLQKWPAFTVPARFFHSVPEDAWINQCPVTSAQWWSEVGKLSIHYLRNWQDG